MQRSARFFTLLLVLILQRSPSTLILPRHHRVNKRPKFIIMTENTVIFISGVSSGKFLDACPLITCSS